jgi:hypothetical protein
MQKYVSNESIENQILTEGKKVKAKILSCKCSDDPEDYEHTIFEIDFEYSINDINVKKSIRFSINTVHIAYAHGGALLGVPKLKYSLDDFKRSLSAGNTFEIISLDTPPYDYINNFNKASREVMQYPQVWM